MKHLPPPVASLKVTHLSDSGKGIARWRNKQELDVDVELPFSMPGDEGVAQILKFPRRHYSGHWIDLKTPAPDREIPLCSHFGSCGGCIWQHLPYALQLEEKNKIVRKFLEAYFHEKTICHPIVPCDNPWQYRNKMELSFSSDRYGNRYLGLILQGTKGHVFQMTECHLCEPWMLEAVRAVEAWWKSSDISAYNCHKNTGSLRTLQLRSGQRTGDRMVMLTVSGKADDAMNQEQLKMFIACLKASIKQENSDSQLSIFLRVQQSKRGEPTQFYEMHLDGADHIREILYLPDGNGAKRALEFKISPTAFFQPNTKQAEKLYAKAIELASLTKDSVVYDLYCGTGTLGLCMAPHVKEVVGIEIVHASILDGRENISHNGVSNIVLHRGDVGAVLEMMSTEQHQKPDVVMVDPPRGGLDKKAIQHILLLRPAKIVYISCNLATQAANLESFVKEGYSVQVVQPVDQFPHTIHIENIVVLTR